MLTHKGTKTINTDRLILRKFRYDDADNMYKNWGSDNNVTKFLSWKPHTSVEETKGIIAKWIEEYKEDNVYDWVIELKELDEVIGGISIVHLDERNSSCEIGYCMSSKYWGRGIMTESLKAVINFLFSEVGFNRIEAKHDTKNIGSGKVMAKSGMKYEGTLRQVKLRNNIEFYDLAIYSILKSEWLTKFI